MVGPCADLKTRHGSGGPHHRAIRIAAATVALAFTGCADEPGGPVELPVRPAKLIEVSAQDNRITVSLPAVFEASATAEIAFQSAGRVESISVREGDALVANAEIARLDQRDARNELATAQARYESARGEFERAELLVEDGAISVEAYEQRRTDLEVARTTLQAARERLDDSVLRAPFDGVIAALHVEAFQNVQPQQPVATLQSDGAAEAIAQAPATLIANSERLEEFRTVVLLDAAPGIEVPGALHSLSARADPTGQTFEARIAFDPPEGVVVLPGMTGAVRSILRVTGAEKSVTVPLGAVFSEAGAQYVWVVSADSMEVARRQITVGDGVGEMLPVLEGLEEGETIVAAGVSFLHDGMRVRRYEP